MWTADLARNFVISLPRVETLLATIVAPAIIKIYRPSPAELAQAPQTPGRVEHWYPKD